MTRKPAKCWRMVAGAEMGGEGMTRLQRMLETLGVGLWWADELWIGGGKRRPGWSGISDVACSRKHLAVSVPRRRRGAHHSSEVVHEVAHLFRWVQTGMPPHRQSELKVCSDALVLAQHFGLDQETLDYLTDELTREMTQREKKP
jgi:hypothetical protein